MTQLVDPSDFIITRKRKKYKFAKFHNSPICYEFEQWHKQPVDVIEVGAGTGLFSVELAQRYPEYSFLAVDVKADRLQKGAYLAMKMGLENISFLRARADQLADIVEASSVGSVWITFPDPFPKKRSSGRRLTHPNYLSLYKKLLNNQGALYLKHDNQEFFQWSLEQLVASHWQISELSFDLHDSELSDDYRVMTSYEQRWVDQGLSTKFVRATFCNRG